jgi:hypothetical protein
MAIRAPVAGLGIALPRVRNEPEIRSGQLVQIGDYAAINAQKTHPMFRNKSATGRRSQRSRRRLKTRCCATEARDAGDNPPATSSVTP